MMKKIIVVLTFIMAVVLAMTGCTGDVYSAVSIKGKQDTSYVVTSNGGSAVKYGNYVYFVNGSRGDEDDNGDANKFGEVVKGGLYRAEFINETENGGDRNDYNGVEGVKDFVPYASEESNLALASTKTTNFKRKTDYVVDNQLLVPKTIGTKGYSDGGVYIFDNYVYYATPANTKDKSGNVMDDYTLFLRTKLDGSVTEEIYTTQNVSSDKPYGFYKYEGKVYLIVMENNAEYGNYINVIDVASKKFKTVATKVASAVFPTNPVYYNGMENNSVYDAIYLKYEANNYPAYKDDQVNRTGYVLAYMRPDGKDIVNFAEGNTILDVVAVRDNLVFYKDVYLTDTVLVARDYDSLFTTAGGFNERVYNNSVIASAEEIYPFMEGAGSINTNAISMLTITSSSSSSADGSTTTTKTLTYYSAVNTQGKTIGSGSSLAVQTHDNTGFYYTVSDGSATYLRHYNLAMGYTSAKTISSVVGTSTFKADKVGSYIVYTATLEDKFDNYTFFADVYAEDYENASEFVGTRVKGDVRSSIYEIVVDEETFDNVKTSYDIGDKLSVKNLKIVIKYYEDEDGNVEEKVVDVKSSWITGFDSSAAADSQELTISYTDGQDSFATTYSVTIS